MPGFHIGVRGKAAGQVVRCTAREGACKLTGADGEPTPHFASLADGEAYLAQQENAYKGGFTAAGNNASKTSDDADTTIDYGDITADALQCHNDTLKQLEHVTKILENINQSRNWLNEHIISPTGDIHAPQIFPTITDKIALLEQSSKYFTTANETEQKLNAIANSLRATLGRNAALALTAEVHRLTHQEGKVGDLLRDLDNKGLLKVTVIPKPNRGEHTISFEPDWETEDDDEKLALLNQASEKLRETIEAYPQDTLKAMTTHASRDQTDESVWPWTSFYLLYTNKFRTIQDARFLRNAQRFNTAILVDADYDDSIDTCNTAESDLYGLISSAADKHKSAHGPTQG